MKVLELIGRMASIANIKILDPYDNEIFNGRVYDIPENILEKNIFYIGAEFDEYLLPTVSINLEEDKDEN